MKDNFRDRMQAKLKASGNIERADLELHDAKVIESGTAVRVLATYSPLKGPPSVWDVQAWLQSRMGAFSNRVQARLDTISAYPERNFITLVVEQKRMRQPISATANMTKAGVDQFLDDENQLWEVVQAEEGPNYILRREGASIEEMLDVRKAALRGGMSNRKNVSLAAVDTIPSAGGGFAAVDVGDLVDFYHGGAIHRGKVQSAGQAGVRVASEGGGGTYTIDPAAITSIIEKSAAAVKESDDVQRRYFSMVYPGNPDMVEIISPTSTGPIKDTRPPPGGDEPLKPITTVAASAAKRVSGSARPFVKTSK